MRRQPKNRSEALGSVSRPPVEDLLGCCSVGHVGDDIGISLAQRKVEGFDRATQALDQCRGPLLGVRLSRDEMMLSQRPPTRPERLVPPGSDKSWQLRLARLVEPGPINQRARGSQ